jgi:hypothetical protein
MTRFRRALIVLLVAGSLAACSPRTPVGIPATPSPSTGRPTGGSDATQIAPGLYDLADGSVEAVGTLEYRDLEGGAWVIVGGVESGGTLGKTLAVIANAANLGSQLGALKGAQVVAKGKRLDGASIRMAGPEISVTSIKKSSDTPDPAQ